MSKLEKVEIKPPYGDPFRLDVEAVKFIRRCPHCDQEFTATDPRQIYPNKSHADMQTRYRRILRHSTA